MECCLLLLCARRLSWLWLGACVVVCAENRVDLREYTAVLGYSELSSTRKVFFYEALIRYSSEDLLARLFICD